MDIIFCATNKNAIIFIDYTTIATVGDVKKELSDVIELQSHENIEFLSKNQAMKDSDVMLDDVRLRIGTKNIFKRFLIMHSTQKQKFKGLFLVSNMDRPWIKQIQKSLCDLCKDSIVLSIKTMSEMVL